MKPKAGQDEGPAPFAERGEPVAKQGDDFEREKDGSPKYFRVDEEIEVWEVAEVLARMPRTARFLNPAATLAVRVRLLPDTEFRRWLDSGEGGRLRVIQRADGFEVAAAIGKVPGPDRHGPSIPTRVGQQDLASLQATLTALRRRFDDDKTLCFVPSFGTSLQSALRAVTAAYDEEGKPLFQDLCLVYPAAGMTLDAGG